MTTPTTRGRLGTAIKNAVDERLDDDPYLGYRDVRR